MTKRSELQEQIDEAMSKMDIEMMMVNRTTGDVRDSHEREAIRLGATRFAGCSVRWERLKRKGP